MLLTLDWLIGALFMAIIATSNGTTLPACKAKPSSDCQFYGDCCERVNVTRSGLIECTNRVGLEGVDTDKNTPPNFYWTVARCSRTSHPESAACNRSVIGQAQGISRDLYSLSAASQPIWGAATGRLYSSLHCLRCHGDRPADRQPELQAVIRCDLACGQNGQQVLDHVRVSGGSLPSCCRLIRFLIAAPPAGGAATVRNWRLRRCLPNLVDRCPMDAEPSLARDCQLGPAEVVPVYAAPADAPTGNVSGTAVLGDTPACYARNPACAECNANATAMACQMLHGPRTVTVYDPIDLVVNFRLDFFAKKAGGDPTGNHSNSSGELPHADGSWGSRVQATLLAASDAGLVCVLAAYASLATLRNRAGLLLISHSAALLLVNSVSLLWLVWPQKELLQLPRAAWISALVLVAFCFNAAFAWAALFGADLLRTVRASLRPASARSPRYARFALIGWGGPALLALGLGLALQLCRELSAQAWRLLQAGLIFAPWMLTLAFNACVLALLWRRLIRAAHQTKRALHGGGAATTDESAACGAGAGATAKAGGGRLPSGSKSTDLTRLAGATGRVSVLLGACWLPYCVVVLADIPRDSSAYAAATAARNLHGLLLCAAFVGNRRVRLQVSDRASTLFRSTSSAISRRLRRPQRPAEARAAARAADNADADEGGQATPTAAATDASTKKSLKVKKTGGGGGGGFLLAPPQQAFLHSNSAISDARSTELL